MKLFDLNLKKGKIEGIVEAIIYFYERGDFEQLEGHSVIHIKDDVLSALESKGLTQEKLSAVGLIFDIATLKKTMQTYQSSTYTGLYKATYLKRIRLGLNNIVVFFDNKQLKNDSLLKTVHTELAQGLFNKHNLPEELAALANTSEQTIHRQIIQGWLENALSKECLQELDQVAEDRLWHTWKTTVEREAKLLHALDQGKDHCLLDHFKQQILPEAVQQQLLEKLQAAFHARATSKVEKVKAPYKDMIRQEMEILDPPRDMVVYYQNILSNILSKWREKLLDTNDQHTIENLIYDQLKQLVLPGDVQTATDKETIKTLLKHYKSESLEDSLFNEVKEQIEDAIGDFLSIGKQTPPGIRESRQQAMIEFAAKALIQGGLSNESEAYIRMHSLMDVRESLRELTNTLDVVALRTQVEHLAQQVTLLTTQLAAQLSLVREPENKETKGKEKSEKQDEEENQETAKEHDGLENGTQRFFKAPADDPQPSTSQQSKEPGMLGIPGLNFSIIGGK